MFQLRGQASEFGGRAIEGHTYIWVEATFRKRCYMLFAHAVSKYYVI